MTESSRHVREDSATGGGRPRVGPGVAEGGLGAAEDRSGAAEDRSGAAEDRSGTAEGWSRIAEGWSGIARDRSGAGGDRSGTAEGRSGVAGGGPGPTGDRPGLNRKDLTIGSIPGHLVSFSLPLLVGNLFQALYNTVDSVIVGRFIGASALGAISASFPIIFFLVAMLMGIGMATTVLVSQYSGARQEHMVRRTIANALAIGVYASVALTAVGLIFGERVLVLLRVPGDIVEMASSYLGIYFMGTIFVVGYNVLSAIFRGLGDSRTPVVFLIVGTVVNIVLDPIFILGIGPVPEMGVSGAAVATVIAQGTTFVASIWYLSSRGGLFTFNVRDLILDRDLTRKTLVIGLPSGVQQTVVSLAMMFLSKVVNSFGTTVVAAFGAAGRLDQFAMMPTMSLGLATSAIAGQNIGAGRDDRVRQVVFWSAGIGAALAAFVSLVALFFPRLLISLFTSDEGVLAVGEQYLRIVGLGYVPFAMMFITNSLLRGAGDTLPGMVFSLLNLWAIRVPLAQYLSGISSLGSRGIWFAILISNISGAAVSWGYFATGRWRRIRLVDRPPLGAASLEGAALPLGATGRHCSSTAKPVDE